MKKRLFAAICLSIMLLTPLVLCAERAGVRLIPVAEGYSSTSVNNAVFRNSSVATHGHRQYIAYYDPEGYLTLGCRELGSDQWQIRRSQYRGKVSDAHNVISIGIDGRGYLHVAFDHHGDKLKYARSVRPGSLELGRLQAMTGVDEDDVTYPEFYNLKGGDLLFAYRSGASGRGNLVLNRYNNKKKRWSRVQDCLIDGEQARNAYWQLCVDADGVIHISWVWRESWLVETNHDLCYTKSTDGGKTWLRSDGTVQQVPITAANAEYAWRIPQRSELINQTSMATDAAGHPYIATYWRDSVSSAPQYRLVWHDGHGWRMSTVGRRSGEFTLSGGGTKMIPISRPRLVTDGNRAYYIYRDSERGSRVSIACTDDIGSGYWRTVDVTDFAVDAWEPTLDTPLWQSESVLNIFVQAVSQGDGERTVATDPTMIYVMELDPATFTGYPSSAAVMDILTMVNDKWQADHPDHDRAFWDHAAYHTGNMEAYRLTGNHRWLEYSTAWADKNLWMGAQGTDKDKWQYNRYGEGHDYVMFGDWQICFQTYIDLYNIDPRPERIARATEVMTYQMSRPEHDFWWWADGLYMVMPVMTKMHRLTGDARYLDKLNEYWHFADSLMYDTADALYYRDAKYIYPKHKSANGKKDFWARGNGWVVAALAKVIADMPVDRPDRQEYIERYKAMAAAVAACQQPEGYWTRSLLDAEHAPGPETSGTAFFTYGLLWGINNGVLDVVEYEPVVMRAWDYLSRTALQPDATIGYVQPIGERAIPGQHVDARSSANFGTGAFLLAACEMYRWLHAKESQIDN